MNCALLVIVVSLDAFVASIAYGSKRIKIPFTSTLIINLICSFFIAISLALAVQFRRILPGNFASILSFIILFSLGVFYLFEVVIKSYLEKKSTKNKELEFKLSNIRFMINIYMDETSADKDYSKELDSREAIYLGTALSLDSLAIGFGSGLGDVNYLYLILFSLLVGMISVRTGLYIGKNLSRNKRINLSWLAGLILIFLAISKIV